MNMEIANRGLKFAAEGPIYWAWKAGDDPMNTKIEGMQGTPVRSSGSVTAASRVGGSRPDSAVSPVDDSVQLSDEAADLASIAKQLGGAPTMDAAKVASVRSALESGSYRINAQEIARRLTQLERELGVGLL